ncbi:hypothetical protein VIGAN_05022000 [Vigna angularis var. angularis]|uniref:RIN4 pathogenic type III effector avirulence factor Avr cleavage site domain-containing protein n=1 Tax=Vigna angularis var. angularis TaxID=157739 RepID=A0A0S3S256_PHAAN|nr:hypothetical protein VIGAN_05022000 [Vigna angularis var. angularis]
MSSVFQVPPSLAMEQKNTTVMSVPQFGGWDQNEGAYDYSVVFNQARATKKHQKTNITEIKSINLENEEAFSSSSNSRHHHHHRHFHFHHLHSHGQRHEVMVKLFSFFKCGFSNATLVLVFIFVMRFSITAEH